VLQGLHSLITNNRDCRSIHLSLVIEVTSLEACGQQITCQHTVVLDPLKCHQQPIKTTLTTHEIGVTIRWQAFLNQVSTCLRSSNRSSMKKMNKILRKCADSKCSQTSETTHNAPSWNITSLKSKATTFWLKSNLANALTTWLQPPKAGHELPQQLCSLKLPANI
jgi:hypothetical protein